MSIHNLSKVSNEHTAFTSYELALQRAENLAELGVKSVLELCVGPSLKVLERAYNKHDIEVVGNDIDYRWKNYYPQGKWLIGDALEIPVEGFDAVVFAPPLSRGCSGSREDSLSINQVNPSYRDFLKSFKTSLIAVLVLPGRSLATSNDRSQYYHLLNDVGRMDFSFTSERLVSGHKKIVKYYDLICKRRPPQKG